MKIAPVDPAVTGKAVAVIEDTEEKDFGEWGGFTAVLSTPSLDRDGDRLHREEWIEPFEDRYPLDIDHGMSVEDTIGSFHPYFSGDSLLMDAYFASTDKAQVVRRLIDEGHIRSVSVAFLTDKSKKDNEPRRELLNAGVVAIPANRDAVILASKAAGIEIGMEMVTGEKDSPKPYGNVTYADPEDGKYPIDTIAHIRAALAYINVPKNYAALGDHAPHVKRAIEAAARSHGIHVADDGKCYWDAEFKHEIEIDAEGCVIPAEIETKAPSGTGDGAALTQAIHDASVHLGAMCYPLVPDEDPSGASDGANKSLDEDPDLVEEKSPDLDLEAIKPEGMTMEQFESALKHLLTPESPEEPAPVEETAAASPAEDWAMRTQLLKMRVRTRL